MTTSSTQPSLIYAIQSFDATGAMRAPYLLLKGFVQAGWQTEIVTMATESNRALSQVWGSVPLTRIDGSSKRQRLLRLAAHFAGKRRHTLVLSWVWDWHCFGLLLSHLLYGTHYAIVLDSYTHRAFGSQRQQWMQAVRYGALLRHASLILAEAPACGEAILKRMPNANVQLVPSSLWRSELVEIESKWASEGWQPVRRPTILYAGRLVERKNVHHLISAFARLADQFPAWSLSIVGPAASHDYAQTLTGLVETNGLSERVHFQPALAGEQLYRKYRESAIYALPSEGEGFPTSILEAMYFGGAIVAGNSGYVAYQLEGGCGLLHNPGDVEQLTQHLQQLMASEDERNRLMQRAKQRVLETFTWENYFPQLEATCRKLVQ